MFSQDMLTQIYDLARALTPVSDIAALLDIDCDVLREELSVKSSPARRAYLKAKAETSLELRRQELEFARVGSPVGMQLSKEFLDRMSNEEDF